MSLLGLDVGTTGCKAVAFSLDGQPVASAYREYTLHSPRPGWQELDPEEVWQAVREVLAEAASLTQRDPIQTLAVSAQGEACHGIDHNGQGLTPSIVTFDGRTADYPQWWLERKSRQELAQITGMPLHGMYSINKMMWFKEHLPEVYAKAWKFVCYEDFVHVRLGLEPVMSHSLAARTMALDLRGGDWSDELLDLAGVAREKIAETQPSGERVGEIPDSVAGELGLPRGILVATGGHDQPAGALGAGVLNAGEAIYAIGTVEAICPVFDAFKMNDRMIEGNLCCAPSCIPGLYASLAFNFTGGSLLKWYRDTFADRESQAALESGRDVYDIICKGVSAEPENLVVLPHFTLTGTPYFDTASRGVIAGLTLNSSRADLVSAILSGVTYEMKLNLELLQSSGVQLRRLRVVGGGAKSALWVQRKADIMGLPVAVLETSEAPALGAAMLGGKASGLTVDLAAFTERAVKILDIVEPTADGQRAYAERYAIYKEMYPAMQAINHRLAMLENS